MRFTSESKFFLAIAAFTLAILGFGLYLFSRPGSQAPVGKDILVASYSPSRGNPDAKVILIEFSDFQCPACAAFAPVVNDLITRYGDQMLFLYRHFPLPAHEWAVKAALAAEAAHRQGKFWEAADILFANQKRFSEDFFSKEFSAILGLDHAQYIADMSHPNVKNRVDKDTQTARSLDLPGTPTFFLNGIRLALYNPQDLPTAVREAINK